MDRLDQFQGTNLGLRVEIHLRNRALDLAPTKPFTFPQLSCFKGISASREAMATRILSVFFGVLATGMAFMCTSLGTLISLGGKIFGATMGPLFGYFLVSVLVPWVNLKGSSAGLILVQALNLW